MFQLRRGSRRLRITLLSLVAITALSLTVAACGSSGSSNSSNSGTSAAANSPQSTVDPKAAGSSAVSTTKVPGYGTVLATANGSALYLLTADPSGSSSCAGACAKQWPPVTTTGKPVAGPGVEQSLLSSFKRTDGSVQVLYAEHALYPHPGTTATAVAGTASDGGIWYLVSPSGKPVKTTNGSGY